MKNKKDINNLIKEGWSVHRYKMLIYCSSIEEGWGLLQNVLVFLNIRITQQIYLFASKESSGW